MKIAPNQNSQVPSAPADQAMDKAASQSSQSAASGSAEQPNNNRAGTASANEAPSKKGELGLAGHAQAAALSEKMDKQSGAQYPVLRVGSQGPKVLELQKRLNETCDPPIAENGQYTEETAKAVMQYQAEHGLKIDGWAGPETLKNLGQEKFAKFSLKSKGAEVQELQKFLNEQRKADGLPPIDEDGSFGPRTQKAVREYQKSRGLKADGVVGSQTMDKIQQDMQAKKEDDEEHIVPPPNKPGYEQPTDEIHQDVQDALSRFNKPPNENDHPLRSTASSDIEHKVE